LPRIPDFDLYLVTDRTQTGGRDLLRVLESALDGGVRAVQLREKDLGGRDLFLLAEKAKSLCARYCAALLINDRLDVALGVDADGVHLGQASLPPGAARGLLGPEKLIGVSTHSLEEALAAEKDGADFVLFGPVYWTPSKAAYGPPLGVSALKKTVDKISLPVYAIGGVNKDNLETAKAAGARGVALISAIISAADPKAAAREVLRALREGSYEGDGRAGR
jgi:thiamine-phosphate pyrophosphorylase